MSKFYEGIAEIFEIDTAAISSDFDLQGADVAWDSLAIVSMIALIDECFGAMLDGSDLTECQTVSDVEALIKQNG
jgi:acyl carrier protein